MVGGGSRRDEGPLINNTNVFAALDSLRRKKKSDKVKGSSKNGGPSNAKTLVKEPEQQVFWAPSPLTGKAWADLDDDDDDYYATAAPPLPVWSSTPTEPAQEKQPEEGSESEEDEDDGFEGENYIEEELDQEPEVPVHPEPEKKPVEVSSATKETERQLSKKERKKKELAELDALLADFGVSTKNSNEEASSDAVKEKSEVLSNGDVEKKDNEPAESKSAKKKKKKTNKEVKESQDQPNSSAAAANQQAENALIGQAEEDASTLDVKERLKKITSIKKKKSSKEMDGAARAVASEAAARNSKLAAAKKKEKSHYNQQPVR